MLNESLYLGIEHDSLVIIKPLKRLQVLFI